MASTPRPLCGALPTTPTNKVLTRALVHEKWPTAAARPGTCGTAPGRAPVPVAVGPSR